MFSRLKKFYNNNFASNANMVTENNNFTSLDNKNTSLLVKYFFVLKHMKHKCNCNLIVFNNHKKYNNNDRIGLVYCNLHKTLKN